MIRTTYYAPESACETLAKRLAPMSDDPDAVYQNNIQIAELNALNASLAIIKYKQIRGFYENETNINHMLLNIKDLHLVVE